MIEKLREEAVILLSLPRLSFTDNLCRMLDLVRATQMSTVTCQHVFYENAMTNLFKNAIDNNFKYALVIDYDSIFNPEDVYELYRIIEATGYDAVVPAQCFQKKLGVIGYVFRDGEYVHIPEQPEEIDCDYIDIDIGHFGLTLVRLDVVKRMEKPWFVHIPDENNEWDAATGTDCRFWLEFAKAGGKIALAPKVRIGHLNQMVAIPNRKLQTIYTMIGQDYDYKKDVDDKG